MYMLLFAADHGEREREREGEREREREKEGYSVHSFTSGDRALFGLLWIPYGIRWAHWVEKTLTNVLFRQIMDFEESL